MKLSVLIGPPGTGKTTTISHWVARAVERWGVESVLVCSLTRTAAHQAAQQIELPWGSCATVHAFAYRGLGNPPLAEAKIIEWNKAYPDFALSGHGTPKTPDDGYLFPEDTSYGDELKSRYTALRTRGVSPDSPLWAFPALKGFVTRWQDWKTQNHYMDFCDLLDTAYEELDTAPGAPKVLLVDEAQDIGPLEMKLLMKWGERCEHFVLVGDALQALFEWRGTQPLLLQELWEKHDPDRKPLQQSYRLPRHVYNYARAFQRHFTMMRQVDYLPRDADGFVGSSRSFSEYDAGRLDADITPYLDAGKTVMFTATCGYMLEPVIGALREAGIPFANPWRPTNGRWSPLPQKRSKGNTIIDRLLAFSRVSKDHWGSDARIWSVHEIKAWAGGLEAAGVLTRGSKKAIGELPDDMPPGQVGEVFAGFFEPEALSRIVPKPDLAWYLSHVKGADTLREFARNVLHRGGVQALEQKPSVYVGTVHSLKGSEADIVYVSPDISNKAHEAAGRSQRAQEEILRTMYVAVTRAKEGLHLCNPSSPYFQQW